MRRLLLAVCLPFCLPPAAARAQPTDAAASGDITQAIRAADWPTAQQLAATMADPVATKLVTFYRLQHQGDASATEIAGFLNTNPDWPDRPTLLRQRDAALANEPDATTALKLCATTPTVPGPRSGPALARCAAAAADAGRQDDAHAYAASAWAAGFPDPTASAAFLTRWAATLTSSDQAARFSALVAAGASPTVLNAQLARLAPQAQPAARARLAVLQAAPDADTLVAALPPAARADPDLVRDQLRALQRTNQDDAALALWRTDGFTAETRAGAPEAARFWALRSQLARRRLRENDPQGAYDLADDNLQVSPETQTDAAFLAGFIALRRLNQPTVAAAHFRVLAGSTAAISQGRAHYWLARAAAAGGDAATARREYAAAAAWPTTYYGQLAALALGGGAAALDDRIRALRDPGWTAQQALDFAGRELTRAASMLVAWGDPNRARPFLARVSALADDPATRSMDAHFALGLNLPDQAVAAARIAGRYGTLLAQAGWPMPYQPPDAEVAVAVALGIMRQESSFDPGAVSPSGALGLMQLMPGTARLVGRQDGDTVPVGALTTNVAANMRLGTTYLDQLIARFGGSLPLAIGAYNAGPNRVDQWLGENNDPRGQGALAMIDWIELIPFGETRNYVQRVIENIEIYRARLHTALPYPVGA